NSEVSLGEGSSQPKSGLPLVDAGIPSRLKAAAARIGCQDWPPPIFKHSFNQAGWVQASLESIHLDGPTYAATAPDEATPRVAPDNSGSTAIACHPSGSPCDPRACGPPFGGCD